MNKKPMIFLILLLITIGQSSIDIYLPSLPSMAAFFKSSINLIQLTLSAFLVGFSISQLFYGPLSDYYGRKPILLIGLSIYIFSGILCLFSRSIEYFLFFRILQGVGIGAASVLSRAIMRDMFSGNALVKVASYSAVAWALVPIIAPLLGGYIQFYTNWKMNFLCLVFFALIMIITIFKWMPETCIIEYRKPLKFKTILTNYFTLLKSHIFLGNAMCVAVLFGVFIVFSAASPFLLQTQLHLSSIQYGWSTMFVASGYLLSSYLNSYLSKINPTQKTILIGFSILCISSLTLLFFVFTHNFSVFSILIPMFFVFFGVGLIYANCIAGCMKPFPKMAGSAGALYGFLVFLGGGISTTFISHFSMKTSTPLAIAVVLQMLASFFIYYLLANKIKEDSTQEKIIGSS
ncbi:MAG: multidrug effflux MFS transporter [Gammaproteobacteria bacterium]